VVFKYGMKRDFNKLGSQPRPSAPVKTLTELRNWNFAHKSAGALKYGSRSSIFRTRWTSRPIARANEADRAKDIALSGAQRA